MYEVKFSKYILSECCNAPIVQQYVYINDAWPTYCVKCYTLLGSPGQEDFHPGHIRPMIRIPDMTDFFEAFAKAVEAASTNVRRLMVAAWVTEHIVGDGTQMEDGKWKPKGFLNFDKVTVDGKDISDNVTGIEFNYGEVEQYWTQESPQSDSDD